MPEVLRQEGYVIYFYANEGHEPVHVHVRRGGGFAKFWVEPLELAWSEKLKIQELRRAEELIAENVALIQRRWHEVHGN